MPLSPLHAGSSPNTTNPFIKLRLQIMENRTTPLSLNLFRILIWLFYFSYIFTNSFLYTPNTVVHKTVYGIDALF
jgi:hypothetical protein